jgi:hypothetical protein
MHLLGLRGHQPQLVAHQLQGSVLVAGLGEPAVLVIAV